MPNSRQCIICNDRYLSSLNDILFNNKIKNANKNWKKATIQLKSSTFNAFLKIDLFI